MSGATPAAMELGLALGGGTARGMAHVGVLKALEERGRAPDVLAGTSSGAVIAALYALGMPALELEQFVRRQNLLELWALGLDFGLHRASLIHGRRLERWLERKVFFGATFAECSLPLAVACTDLRSGELVIVREGSLARAVVASCALPGIFAAVEIDSRPLIDGGFVEAVPFRALASLGPKRLVGVHAGLDPARSRLLAALRRVSGTRAARAWSRHAGRFASDGPFARLGRGVSCALRSYSRPQLVPPAAALLRIDPPLAWWDFHRSPEAIAAGERAALAALAAGLLDVPASAPAPSGEAGGGTAAAGAEAQ